MDTVIFSPYLTFLLSFLVLYRWAIKLVYDFEWMHLGGLASRLFFCILYGVIVFYNPSSDVLRLAVRTGFNLLFLDELINWWLIGKKERNKVRLKRLLSRISDLGEKHGIR